LHHDQDQPLIHLRQINPESSMKAVFVTAKSVVSACGVGIMPLLETLQHNRCMLKPPRLIRPAFETVTGEVETPLTPLNATLSHYDCRNSRIALAALDCEGARFRHAVNTAVDSYGSNRVGTVIGTSTSGIYETELAYQARNRTGELPSSYNLQHQHGWGATADFLKHEMALAGPCYAISTACSSSGKAIAAGQRLIAANLCDAVIVGGVDSLCHMTLHGFHSLELTAPAPCRPLDRDRDGINLGEGAGLLLLERHPVASNPALVGYGESSDAYHMTAPSPDGQGSAAAMQQAINTAGLNPDMIDYVNLHATGTIMNDASEMHAMRTVFPHHPPCSGIKGMIGHTLGAAGAIEAIVALLAIEFQFAPGNHGLQQLDPTFAEQHVLAESTPMPDIRFSMSNNFGFGGNNASLIFAREIQHG